MQQVNLEATLRSKNGSAESRRLRKKAVLPAVLYGKGIASVMVSVAEKEFLRIFDGGKSQNVIINLQVKKDGGTEPFTVVVKALQKDPVSAHYLHVDFQQISLFEKMQAKIPVHIMGEAVGVKEGGVLEQVLHEVTVECLPKDIPSHLEVDVTSLAIGQTMTVSSIVFPENVLSLTLKEEVVVSLHAPMKEEVVEVAAPVTAAEPEVIKEKGKQEKEETEVSD